MYHDLKSPKYSLGRSKVSREWFSDKDIHDIEITKSNLNFGCYLEEISLAKCEAYAQAKQFSIPVKYYFYL
jgi:hypothetical protein